MFTGYRKRRRERLSLSVLFAFSVCRRTLRAVIFVRAIRIHQANCASPQDLSAICSYSSVLDLWECILTCQYQVRERYLADCERDKLSCRFSFCERTAELQSLLQENVHSFSLLRSENNGGCWSIPDLQIRGRSTLTQSVLLSPPASHAGLATCGRLLAPNSVALPKGFPPSLLSGSLALFGFNS